MQDILQIAITDKSKCENRLNANLNQNFAEKTDRDQSLCVENKSRKNPYRQFYRIAQKHVLFATFWFVYALQAHFIQFLFHFITFDETYV